MILDRGNYGSYRTHLDVGVYKSTLQTNSIYYVTLPHTIIKTLSPIKTHETAI